LLVKYADIVRCLSVGFNVCS